MSTLVGTLLDGRYRLEELIGAGGMSTVYRALDLTLERQVAIKLMHREFADDSDQLERFRREARAVAQLSHPHIVSVIDAGEDQGRPYIVFEYIAGQTLKARIRSGQIPIPEAVAYAIEIARALGAAHARNIVHRDVKPQNVLIDAEGSAKVTDFGIARSLDEEGLTADGRVLGTTDYVSPEQAMGQPVTGQSDVYSLGIVLWEMLVGSPPFQGENQVAVAMKHVREPLPDVQVRRPNVSAALGAVVEHATSKRLHRRYAGADEIEADLEEALAIETARAGQVTGEATSVLRTLPGPARSRLPLRLRVPTWVAPALALVLVLTGVLVVIMLAGSTHRGTGRPAPTPAPQRGAPALVGVSLAAGSAHDYDPLGDKQEHPGEVSAAVDDNANTFWSTETYQSSALAKAGVGIYVDAAPDVLAHQLRVQTDTPGFSAEVYGASGAHVPGTLPDPAWIKLAGPVTVRAKTPIDLDTASGPHRFFLLWITRLPPGKNSAHVNELSLYRTGPGQ